MNLWILLITGSNTSKTEEYNLIVVAEAKDEENDRYKLN